MICFLLFIVICPLCIWITCIIAYPMGKDAGWNEARAHYMRKALEYPG